MSNGFVKYFTVCWKSSNSWRLLNDIYCVGSMPRVVKYCLSQTTRLGQKYALQTLAEFSWNWSWSSPWLLVIFHVFYTHLFSNLKWYLSLQFRNEWRTNSHLSFIPKDFSSGTNKEKKGDLTCFRQGCHCIGPI